MPTLLERFLDPARVSLKICGVRTADDAARLVDRGVDALGVNFWPESKRYLSDGEAAWLASMKDRILRVGVFVNESPDLPLRLFRDGWIDLVQLHGDEAPADAAVFVREGVPFLKAVGVAAASNLEVAATYQADGVLLDAHAPGVYGGTGEPFDWNRAVDFQQTHPDIPLLLAGGITPENAAEAAGFVRPCALDVASGAEAAPGVKDMEKVDALMKALGR